MIVFVDVDGVLADFPAGFLAKYKEKGGVVPEGFSVSFWGSLDTLPDAEAVAAFCFHAVKRKICLLQQLAGSRVSGCLNTTGCTVEATAALTCCSIR